MGRHRVGLAPPPLETPKGWLLAYRGVRITASGSLYRVGLALLDLEEPWRVLRRSPGWVLGPETLYGRVGDVPGVVFPTVLHEPEEEPLRLYYGDMVGVAEARLPEVLDYLRACPGG